VSESHYRLIAEQQKLITYQQGRIEDLSQYNAGAVAIIDNIEDFFRKSYDKLIERIAELENDNDFLQTIRSAQATTIHNKCEKIRELESEVKALRLIANGHSMSELRRMKIMTNYKPGPEKEVKE
jgi:hypothetical protein